MTCICVATLSSVVAQGQDLPVGALSGEFKIGESKTVRFSKGNLVYDQATESFLFAETQTAYGSYFGWGTSGYHDPNDVDNIHYQPWDETITYDQSKTNNITGYGPSLVGTGEISFAPGICWNGILGSRYANYDWGVYNPITNGGNTAGLWRTLTKDEWIYLLTNNPHEMKTIDDIYGLQITATDDESTVFLPAAGYRGLSGKSATSGTYTPNMYEVNTNCNYWSSSADDAGSLSAVAMDYSKDAQNDAINYNRFNGFSVRLVMDVNPVDGAWITVSDKADNSELLANYKKETPTELPVNVHIIRSLTPDMSNTLTLPFNVAESEMEAIFGTDYELLQLNEDDPGSINVEAQEFAVNLIDANSIEAGVPYLITPTQAVNNMHFINRVIQRATNDECVAGAGKLVEFHGLLDKTQLTAGDKTCLFLYPNNTLVWSAENDNSSMNSLRAYFKVNTPAGAPLRNFAPRMVVTSPSVTTDYRTIGDSRTIHNSHASGALSTIHKILKDGQLMIVRDTIVLNLFGQRIK